MNVDEHFLSCDWGTSNFRIRLVKKSTLEVLVEHKTNQGIKNLNDLYCEQESTERNLFFSNYLIEQASKICDAKKLPTIAIAGMASSNIGLKELKYGQMPIDNSGQGIHWESIENEKDIEILLISGIQDGIGIMRGEETQALGLMQYLDSYQTGILVLPGTHSKHLSYVDKKFTSMKSFMTGELFELLSEKSILSNNVEKCQWIHKRRTAFEEGLKIGFEKALGVNLFSIRSMQMLHNTNKKDNYFKLSGMLIGDELSYLRDYQGKLFLAASEPFFSLYKLALNSLLGKGEIIAFGDNVLEKALLLGQFKILDQHERQL